MSGGLFISLEGIDGVGKSTQSDLLESYLRSLGKTVVRTLEPGGTELGQEIRHLLLHRKGDVAPRSEALLYAADRAHHVATKVRPALQRGEAVITDRYLDSSVAYQGVGRDLNADDVRSISMFAVENLLPDLTILLDLDASAAMARRSKTGEEPDRLEREKVEFFEAVRQAYLAMAKAEPQRWLIVDASQTVDQMHAQIRARIDQVLASR
jgi:dTMP kinase